jgi:hypothetical protein
MTTAYVSTYENARDEYFNEYVLDTMEITNLWVNSFPCFETMIAPCATHLKNPETPFVGGTFTLNDVAHSMGLRSSTVNHLPEPVAIELGKFINSFIPDRIFQTTTIKIGAKKMTVKLYNEYERELVEHLVKIFMNRTDLISPQYRKTLYHFTMDELFDYILDSVDSAAPEKEMLFNLFNGKSERTDKNKEAFLGYLTQWLPEEFISDDDQVDAHFWPYAVKKAYEMANDARQEL